MAKATRRRAPRPRREPDPTGIEAIDRLAGLASCTMPDYIRAVSTYVREQSGLAAGPKKAAQIRLSNALGRVLVEDLRPKLPNLGDAIVGERNLWRSRRSQSA
jgi:hypothetical protein